MKDNFSCGFTKLSDVVQYLRCPRKVYFGSKNGIQQNISPAFLKHILIKELAFSFPELLRKAPKTDELIILMKEKLNELPDEIIHIYAAELEAFSNAEMQNVSSEVSKSLAEIASNLSMYCDENGKEMGLKDISPFETEIILSNEKLKITGTIPALVMLGEKLSPMLIKTGKNPERGIWKNDRIHLAASAFLTEEHTGTPVTEGIVEYAAFGNIRKVRIHTTDRRNAINVIKKIEKIKKGKMPEKKEGPLCESCEFQESCISEPTSFASRLF